MINEQGSERSWEAPACAEKSVANLRPSDDPRFPSRGQNPGKHEGVPPEGRCAIRRSSGATRKLDINMSAADRLLGGVPAASEAEPGAITEEIVFASMKKRSRRTVSVRELGGVEPGLRATVTSKGDRNDSLVPRGPYTKEAEP